MTIIFNTDQVYLHGGIEKVMATKANFFSTLPNVQVYIVTTEQENNPPCYPLDSRIKLIDLGVNYNRGKSYFSGENIKKARTHYKKQKALFRDLKSDVIISPNFNFDHYWLPFIKNKALLIKERHSSRYLETEERQKASGLKKIRFWLNDKVDDKYDKIVTLNQDEKSYVKSNNAVVIPNPIESTNLWADMTSKKVIAAGRISPVKAFDQLIETWAMIAKDFPDWELHFYGQDYLHTQQQLETQIKTAKLEDKIQFKGSVNNMTKTMTDYSIYAMSSVTECFPMVLLEALSVGLPIVSYDSPNGPRHIITNNEDGLLTDYKNPKKLADKLTILMSNENLRSEMSAKAKQNAIRFTTKEVMKQWLTLLNLPHV